MNQITRKPEFDIEDLISLLPYLREKDLIDARETAVFRQLTGGVSNRVVLVEPDGRAPFVVK